MLPIKTLGIFTLIASMLIKVECADQSEAKSEMVEDCKVIPLTLSHLQGYVANPTYPNLVLFSEMCWILHMPPSVFMHYYIQVNLNEIDLHMPEDCATTLTDFVEFREGQSKKSVVLGRWCSGSAEKDVIVSCTSDLMVWLHRSDSSTEKRGLNISYSVIKRDSYDCYTRSKPVEKDPDIEDGAIAGVAIFILVSLLVIAVIVVLKTRQSPDDPDPQRVQGEHRFWRRSSGFEHQRFENEGFPNDDNESHSGMHGPQRDLSLSASMRSTRPLPIGIPCGTYRPDGFPLGYACNIPDAKDPGKVGKCSDEAGAGVKSGQNPLYEYAFPQSGLPADENGGIKHHVPKVDPLASSLPAETSGLQLGQALEARLTEQGQISRSAPGVTHQGEIMLSFAAENPSKDESFA